MSAKVAKAFAPAGISSFFEICDTSADGNPIADSERVGARGGGFVVQKGVTTTVSVTGAETSSVRVFINGRLAPEAETTASVAQVLLGRVSQTNEVIIKHAVDVPIGAGFGSSAAGARCARRGC